MTVEDKKCPVFVDGEECGHPLIRVDLETQKNSQIRLSIVFRKSRRDQSIAPKWQVSVKVKIRFRYAGAAQNSGGWLLSVHSGLRLDPASLCGIWLHSHGEKPPAYFVASFTLSAASLAVSFTLSAALSIA